MTLAELSIDVLQLVQYVILRRTIVYVSRSVVRKTEAPASNLSSNTFSIRFDSYAITFCIFMISWAISVNGNECGVFATLHERSINFWPRLDAWMIPINQQNLRFDSLEHYTCKNKAYVFVANDAHWQLPNDFFAIENNTQPL